MSHLTNALHGSQVIRNAEFLGEIASAYRPPPLKPSDVKAALESARFEDGVARPVFDLVNPAANRAAQGYDKLLRLPFAKCFVKFSSATGYGFFWRGWKIAFFSP